MISILPKPQRLALQPGAFQVRLPLKLGGNAVEQATLGHFASFLDELCELFPGPYIHLGGDEVKTEHWESCPACRKLVQEREFEQFDDLLPEHAQNVLGTQGALWTEFVEDEERIQWNGFPRLAAKAEVGWSQPEQRDYADFRDRWTKLAPYLEHLGLANHAPLAACDPSLYRRTLGLLLDVTRDMQSEQKRWQGI